MAYELAASLDEVLAFMPNEANRTERVFSAITPDARRKAMHGLSDSSTAQMRLLHCVDGAASIECAQDITMNLQGTTAIEPSYAICLHRREPDKPDICRLQFPSLSLQFPSF